MSHDDGVPAALPPSAQLLQMANPVLSRVVQLAAGLGLADQMAAGPQTVDALAAATGTHADSLHRLLRALTGVGIFSQQADGRYTLTPLAEPLRSDAPDTIRSYLMLMDQLVGPALAALEHSVRTGQAAFDHVFGRGLWEHLAANPDAARVSDSTFLAISGAVAAALLDVYDFSAIDTLVDVGGGYGGLILPLLHANPGLHGVIVDLPHVNTGADEQIHARGFEDRCRFDAGDFFTPLPPADAYLLKNVLRDWPDDDAIELLRNCARSLSPNGTVLIVEWVIPDGAGMSPAKFADLVVMALLPGGRDRTEAEFRTLLTSSGLHLDHISALQAGPSLLEATSTP
jgi:hypothetical protein